MINHADYLCTATLFSVLKSVQLQLQIAPYPGKGDLQTSLDNHVEWTAYKQQVVRDSRN